MMAGLETGTKAEISTGLQHQLSTGVYAADVHQTRSLPWKTPAILRVSMAWTLNYAE